MLLFFFHLEIVFIFTLLYFHISYSAAKLFFPLNLMATPGSDLGVIENQSALLNILCKQYSGLHIVHFNSRSLNGLKFDYVRNVFQNSDIDVICVTETWFRTNVSEIHYRINGFKLFQACRENRRGGGVAVYYKDNLKCKLLNVSDDLNIEYLNIEISNNVNKILISCVYNPNRSFSLDPFFDDMKTYVINYDYYLICGDFNVNLLNKDRFSDNLCNMIDSLGLEIVNSRLPTRFSPGNSPSLLDLFLVSDSRLCLFYDQISFVSDHDLIFCTIGVNLSRAETPLVVNYRDYKSLDYSLLYSDLALVDWTNCWYQPTVDGKLNNLLHILENMYERHVPLRSVRVRNNECPWYSQVVKQSFRERNRLYNVWKRNPTPPNRIEFTRARNRSNLLVRQAKKAYFERMLNVSLPSQQLWKNVRKLGIHTRDYNNPDFDPDELNNYFCETLDISDNQRSRQMITTCNSMFAFSNVSETDVFNAVVSIRSNAVGEDGLPVKFLKIILPFIVSSLTHIFNHIITTSIFPELWKISRIIPIKKKQTANCLSDYRPISILPVLAKVFESLISKQITGYLNINELISPLQSGFRAAHSCTTAALKVLDDIRPEYDVGNMSLMCFLDFSKAFDKIDHSILLMKLKHYYGFDDKSLRLMKNYLTGRSQRVLIGEKISSLRMITSGVPQGSVLGPLMFSMFVNDIFNVVNYARIHAYADDMQLYISNRIGLLEDMCHRLNEDLESIVAWSMENKLVLNPGKSFVLPISRHDLDSMEFPNIYLNTSVLKYVRKVKYLGFHLNSTLTCKDHINIVVRNVFLTLRNLRMSGDYVPIAVKKRLVLQLILPLVNYSAQVYSKLDSQSLHKLEVALNNATRYVFGISRFESVSTWRNMILGCELTDYLSIRNLCFLHELLYKKIPGYLYEKLTFGTSTRSITLITPRHMHLNTSRFFFINAIKLWNSLPHRIKVIRGKNNFAKALFDYYTN